MPEKSNNGGKNQSLAKARKLRGMGQITGNGETIMPGHVWDLEERATAFALAVRGFVRRLPASAANSEDSKQLIRSSGSVPANYIEANEALGNKDRVMKLRISRKESKESQLWLRLLFLGRDADLEKERERLRQEAHELKLIFTSIIKKLE